MLQLSEVSAGYRRGDKVLHNVDLCVEQGQLVAILGANGAGKTTTLRAASGLVRPSSGSVKLDGVEVTTWSSHRLAAAGICHVPEGRGIFPTLTVEENLKVYAGNRRNANIADAYSLFPVLRSMRDRAAGNMSGGQQQMLALSRAYISNPKVALLDEVSMGLAPLIVDEIFDVFPRILERGTSLLIVEQYVDRALKVADAAVVLSRGEVVFSGPPATLRASTELVEAYLGSSAVAAESA